MECQLNIRYENTAQLKKYSLPTVTFELKNVSYNSIKINVIKSHMIDFSINFKCPFFSIGHSCRVDKIQLILEIIKNQLQF